MKKEERYILNHNIALRSWKYVPNAYYIKGELKAAGLTNEEFMLLLKCDGKKEITTSQLLQSLVNRGLCSPCEVGRELNAWQKPLLCQNRYFPAMNWEITGRCNYNCRHCFNAADNAPLQSEFSWEECISLMDQARECGINAFTITGGEPMLHPNFMDILRGIHTRGMYVQEINTNGSYITEEMLKEMKAFGCMPLMKISFDGVGHHDWMRVHSGAEKKALNAIELCIKNGFSVMAQTNVHRLNVDCMLQTIELLDKLGVSETRIIRTTEAPRWLKNSDGLCEGGACLTFNEYYDTMLELARAYAQKSHNMKIDVWRFLNIYPTIKKYSYQTKTCGSDYRDSLVVCRGTRGLVGVTASGDLVLCLQMSGYYSGHGIQLGNVKKQPLSQLLTYGDYIKTVCTNVGQLARSNEKCGGCRWWKLCGGGCRAIGLALTDDQLGEDKAMCLYFNGDYIEKTDAAFKGSGYLPLHSLKFDS